MTDSEKCPKCVDSDIDSKHYFIYGTTALGGMDYVQPVSVGDGVVICKSGNLGKRYDVPFAEYERIRQRPMVHVGIWSFAPADDPSCGMQRQANRDPSYYGKRCYKQTQKIATITTENTLLAGIVRGMLPGLDDYWITLPEGAEVLAKAKAWVAGKDGA